MDRWCLVVSPPFGAPCYPVILLVDSLFCWLSVGTQLSSKVAAAEPRKLQLSFVKPGFQYVHCVVLDSCGVDCDVDQDEEWAVYWGVDTHVSDQVFPAEDESHEHPECNVHCYALKTFRNCSEGNHEPRGSCYHNDAAEVGGFDFSGKPHQCFVAGPVVWGDLGDYCYGQEKDHHRENLDVFDGVFVYCFHFLFVDELSDSSQKQHLIDLLHGRLLVIDIEILDCCYFLSARVT